MKPCPFCAEQIQDDAKICRFCQSDLSAAVPAGPPETSGMAIASMVLGFLSWIFPAAIAAIVLGHISRSQIRQSSGRRKGAGMALAGLIMGYFGLSIIPILIIAAIAIPNLLRARITANETSAVGSMRQIHFAAGHYLDQFGQYPAKLEMLGPSAGAPSANAADLIDSVLATGHKSGYQFLYEAVDTDGDGKLDAYAVRADPITMGTTGQRSFYVDTTGIIRMNVEGPADAESPPIS